jgi:hypothetical protein
MGLRKKHPVCHSERSEESILSWFKTILAEDRLLASLGMTPNWVFSTICLQAATLSRIQAARHIFGS